MTTPTPTPAAKKPKQKTLAELYEEGLKLGLHKEMKAILEAEMKRRGLLNPCLP